MNSNDLYETRVKALEKKHAHLSNRVEEALKRPANTDYYLQQLKKQKLQVKDQLERMRLYVANEDMLQSVS